MLRGEEVAMNMLATRGSGVRIETDKTGETYRVSNGAFLRTLFAAAPTHLRPLVVSFEGDPSSAHGKAWHARPWMDDDDVDMALSAGANNYFSLAVFWPDEAGRYRRQKSRFGGLYAVMLDDIGTKVAEERVTLAPTWILETSPGNHQVGYLLRDPLTDGKLADGLMNAIVSAGLCDPGANGPRTRLARLPVAVNGKHSPPFPCRMVTWAPDLRYSVRELEEGLAFKIAQPAGSSRQARCRSSAAPVDGDPILIPPPAENAIIAALNSRGLYKSPLGGGRHDITCPWVEAHTGMVDHGTAYFEPDEKWPIGGFKCLHGHCAGRHISDLLGFLEIDLASARMTPTIRVVPGEIHRGVDSAERLLARSERYYQRGGLIVTVISDPGTRETRLQQVPQPALVCALAGAAIWEKFDSRKKAWIRVDPPARYAAALHDAAAYPHLPVLRGLARQPYLRPDGSLMTEAGYDAGTGMYGVFDTRQFNVPDCPTHAEAEAALEELRDLLSEFSFATEHDRAAAIAAILTATVRPSLALSPLFHARAHVVGSGKSYLCELITAFATAQRGMPTTFPGDDEECRKLLLAELLRGPAVIEFDNLTSDLVPHKSLCTALTSEFLTGRILGASKTASVSTRTLFLSSGNNVGPVKDMTRRCITIHLDPAMEVPAARSFSQPHLVRDVLRQRGRYVSAVLTIVRAWIVAGRPKTECKPLASYEEWSEVCRQPLLWLGCPDPAGSVFEAIDEDPDRETLARLLLAWRSAFGSTATRVRDAVKLVEHPNGTRGDLCDILEEIAGERGDINRRKLGWWIKRHNGRIVSGLRFARGSGNSSAEMWRVESVSPVLPVIGGAQEEIVIDADAYRRAKGGE